MSVRRLSPVQPDSFAFTEDNLAWAKKTIAKYPPGKQFSAVIPLLWRAQTQAGGWLPEPALRHVGDLLGMPYIRVYEVATFYTMFNLAPVGRYHVQLCGTTPCWLRGADDLKAICRQVIGEPGRVSEDGLFSWIEVECLGACVNAPMVQINEDYYEDLTAESFERILAVLREGREVVPGPQVERQLSAPIGGATTLLDDQTAGAAAPTVLEDARPRALKRPRKGRGDDLTRIAGIGPRLEEQLHELGIFHYDQIAEWSEENVRWLDQRLRFKGRIGREKWVEQARAMTREET